VTTRATPGTTAPPDGSGPAAPHPGSEALALTLAPVAAPDFFAEHWERRPLVVPRDDPARFTGILGPDDVERLLCETGIRTPGFRLVKEGAQLPLAGYTEDIAWRPGSFSGTAVVERVAREFEQGATLVLQALHLHWPAAALYCRSLEQSLGCPVQVNAYLTPAAARGFAVHHDTHDVFVLQVSGRKRWRLYEPVLELPLKNQRWSPRLGDPGPPVEDFELEAGQTLYLPRGWPHEATTSGDESLHLTVGIHPTTRMDALRMALDSCADDPEFRRSLAADGRLPGHLLEQLAARLEPAEVARRARLRFAGGRRPILHGQLDQVRDLERLSARTPVVRRPTVILELEHDSGGVRLVFEGKEMRFPAKAAPAMEAVCGTSRAFTAADLPGPLDEAGRVVLVRRLVREGLLRQV
jgi:bifunctional lysine-specific demethylase and histidyl-hydroxylase NO66